MPISKKEVTKRLKLDLLGIKGKGKRDAAKQEVGEFVVDKIQDLLDKSRSPVKGVGKFRKLSEKYAKDKKKGNRNSDLFLKGDMRSQVDFEMYRDGVDVGVFNDDEAPKAFNHNQGDTLPRRQFIPEKKQIFKDIIQNGIDKILEGHRNDRESKTDK